MALAVLDGNQSATTLSSVVTGGEHIVAHSVVSLGSNAISNIATAVSGTTVCVGSISISGTPSVTGSVSVLNFPASQTTTFGAVTGSVSVLNFPASQSVTFGQAVVSASNITGLNNSVGTDGNTPTSTNFIKIGGHQDGANQVEHIVHVSAGGAMKVDASDSTVTFGVIRGTVTIGNSITIGSLPPISGTVTANVQPQQSDDTDPNIKFIPIGYATVDGGGQLDQWTAVDPLSPLPVYFPSNNPLPAGTNRIGVVTIGGGTVTIGAGTAQIGVVTIGNIRRSTDGATTQLTTEVGSGYLEVRSYIGAGTAQIGSVTASISGTVPISISSVTVGNSVTIASLPAISGTVTANLAISSSAITSGSFTSLASATLVPANTARKMATVYNLGAGQLFINAGASATTLGGGFMVALSSGDYFECPFTTTTLSAIFATAGTASWVSH
jgi:hypothetical protein